MNRVATETHAWLPADGGAGTEGEDGGSAGSLDAGGRGHHAGHGDGFMGAELS